MRLLCYVKYIYYHFYESHVYTYVSWNSKFFIKRHELYRFTFPFYSIKAHNMFRYNIGFLLLLF